MSVTALWLLSTVADLQFCLQVCWATLKRQACFNGKRYFPFHILETTEPFWLKWKQNCIDTEQSKRAIKNGCIVRQLWKELLCKAGDSDREPRYVALKTCYFWETRTCLLSAAVLFEWVVLQCAWRRPRDLKTNLKYVIYWYLFLLLLDSANCWILCPHMATRISNNSLSMVSPDNYFKT